MGLTCCLCRNSRRQKKSLFVLPKVVKKDYYGEMAHNSSLNRRNEWLRIFKNSLGYIPNNKIICVCSIHFIKGKPCDNSRDPDWIPSLNIPVIHRDQAIDVDEVELHNDQDGEECQSLSDDPSDEATKKLEFFSPAVESPYYEISSPVDPLLIDENTNQNLMINDAASIKKLEEKLTVLEEENKRLNDELKEKDVTQAAAEKEITRLHEILSLKNATLAAVEEEITRLRGKLKEI